MIESLVNFIEQHPQWAFVSVFIIAFAESLAIVGLLIPGWLLLVAIGVLIGQEIVNFYWISFGAFLGAAIGEYISFYLGYRYHKKILALPIVAKRKALTDYAHQFFVKHGTLGVFLGRFLGPTRAVVPFIAGLSQMDKTKFAWVNVASALIWAPLNLIPGILIGAAYQLESEKTNVILIFLLSIGLTIGIAVHYIKQINKKEILKENLLKFKLLIFKLMLSISLIMVSSYMFTTHAVWSDFIKILRTIIEKI